MKNIILLVMTAFFTFSTLASPSDSPHRFYPQGGQDSLGNIYGLQDILIFSLIAKRCKRYLPVEDHFDCKEAVSLMLGELDTDILFPETENAVAPGSFLFVAFKQLLINSLSDLKTQQYLEKINADINGYLTGEIRQFNLWNSSVQFFKSKKLAARAIAVLFQDTTHARLHLAYLEKAKIRTGAQFESNKNLLNQTIDQLSTLMDLQDQKYIQLFYPDGVKSPINRNFYHFYVPFFLGQQLAESGVSARMSTIAPLLMTLTYEFVTSADDYRYVFADPETINKSENWKLKDIFAGYQGSALSCKKSSTPLKSFQFLEDNFSISTFETVKALLSTAK
jgi:hypothetical protein